MFLRKVKDRRKELKQKRIFEKKMLYQTVIQNRIRQYNESDKSYGHIGKLAKKWNVTHTNVRRFLKKHNLID